MEFPGVVLNLNPRKAFLRGANSQDIRPSVPLRKESLTTTTYLFFLMEMVVISCLGLSDPVNTSDVAGPSSSSHVVWHSTSRASNIVYRGTWQSEVVREGFHLLPK